MVSSFGWLDADDDQSRKMLDVVDQFREPSTLDDLGIGSIRDALADELFPGTSTLHTRLRYALFVPWLIQRAAEQSGPTQMRRTFDADQYRLIRSLQAGGTTQGVIGARAGRSLRVWPNTMYWSCLQVWGILSVDASLDSVFRRAADRSALRSRAAPPDDAGAAGMIYGDRGTGSLTGLDPGLPPAPADLLSSANFALRPEDERYFSDRITQSTAGSLLAWLVVNQLPVLPDEPWDLPTDKLPLALARTLDHARRFSVTIHGAHLVYNLLLAERSGRATEETNYHADLTAWEDELAASHVLADWDLPGFWAVVARHNHRVAARTRLFVETWVQLLADRNRRRDGDSHGAQSTTPGGTAAPLLPLADDARARRLIETRERDIKHSRARLANPAALDAWGGASGLGRLTYRWTTARSHLGDLYAARDSRALLRESA